jgi:aminopeptidase
VEAAKRLADLAVGLGANVQQGQVVRVSAEVGHEATLRAVAESAYRAGARFVDVNLFDPVVQRARILHAPVEALEEIPGWEVERLRILGNDGGASIKLVGPAAPGVFDDLNPKRVGRVSLPSLPQWREVEPMLNWTVVPSPTVGWAKALRPELSEDEALGALWDDVVHVCRLDQPDPVAEWRVRLDQLRDRAMSLNALRLDSVRLEGPGTDLRVGLFRGACWEHPVVVNDRGVEHVPNLPTEEVFTVPDPRRVDGRAKLTRPALVGGRLIEGVTLEFRAGRVAQVEGSDGVEALSEFVSRDGADRVGELALVDETSRVGRLGRTFGVILLDENAVSHIALGYGFPELVDEDQRGEVNSSSFHLDVMVGAEDVNTTGFGHDGREYPLLRGGQWVGA